MQVWLYVFLCRNRACVCRCDCDAICVGHDLNRCYGGGKSAVYMLNSVGKSTQLWGTPVLNSTVWMCGFCMLCKLCIP